MSYISQTTFVADWPVRPELVLVVFCLFFSGRRYAAASLGFLTGLFLDAVNGCSFYNTALYALSGMLVGFLPASVFRDYRSLALVGLLLSSAALNCGYPALSWLLAGQPVYAPLLSCAGALAADVLVFFLLSFIFARRRYD
ncbi:MAG: hypothetical protein LBD99_07225 [Candidatus Margulisbacteria bacterium]|nr:hypothetical protein [Candidatus Margulisiibacteriota bacterium]